MLVYFQLLFKKFYKSKTNIFPLGFVFFLIISVLLLNMRATSKTNFQTALKEDIRTNQELLTQYKEAYQKEPTNQDLPNVIQIVQNNLSLAENSFAAFEQKNYSQAYEYNLEMNKQILETNEKAVSDEFLNALNYQQLLLSKLKEQNIQIETQSTPITAIAYSLSIVQFLFPIALSFVLCMLLANIFTNKYTHGIDKSKLLPFSSKTIKKVELLFAIVLSSCLFFSFYLVAFAVAGLVNGIGSWEYPTQTFSVDKNILATETIQVVLFKSIILQYLSTVFLVVFMYLLSIFIKEKLNLLFASVAFLVAPSFVLPFIVPLRNSVHLIPNIYLSATNIATGQFAQITGNSHLNFSSGVIVNSLGIVFLLAIIFSDNRLKGTKRSSIKYC